MANNVDIVFNGVDKVSSVIQKIANANDMSAKSLFNAVGGFDALGKAAGAAVNFLKDSINSTIEYSESVRAMMRVTGESAEETSRLIQVSDDLLITQGELEAAMRGATTKGIDVSTEGLKRLSEEYLSLDKGLERSEFLIEKFGRSGLAMGKMMEKGADGITEMYASVSDGLVVTQDTIDASAELQASIDSLEEAQMQLGYTVGREVIPPFKELVDVFNAVLSGVDKVERGTQAAEFLASLGLIAEKYKSGYVDTVEEAFDELTKAIAEEVEKQDKALGIGKESAFDYAKALEESAKESEKFYQDAIKNTREFMKFNDDYIDQIDEVKKTHVELVDEKNRLIEEGYWEESDAIIDVNTKIDENTQKYYDLMAAQEEERKQMLLNIATEGLDYQSKLDILFAMGQLDGATYNSMTTIGEIKKQYEANQITADEYKYSIDAINLAMSQGKNVDVAYTVHMRAVMEADERWADIIAATGGNNVRTVYDDSKYTRGGGLYGDQGDYAQGGAFVVPPGFPRDSYKIGVSSGEYVSVTPAGDNAHSVSGGAGVNVYLSYSPVVSLADRYEAETKLVPYIESALRKIR